MLRSIRLFVCLSRGLDSKHCIFMAVVTVNFMFLLSNYPRESFRQGLWNHPRTFVCLSVCLSVATITK